MQVYSSFNPHKNKSYYKKPFFKTRGFYFLLIIFVLLLIFVWWSIKTEPQETEVSLVNDVTIESTTSINIDYINGILEKVDENKTTLNTGDSIKQGETIKTGSNTKVILKFPDGSLIRLGSNTEMNFEQFGQGEIIINQITGNAYHRISENSPAIYRVKHNNVEFTALGTGFNVNVLGDVLKLAVIESRIKIRIFDKTDAENVISMRTVDEGYVAIVDTTESTNEMIDSTEKEVYDLLEDEWLVWNKDEDQKLGLYLGVFASNVQLNITEPEKIESKTSLNSATIKGTTDPQAEIYILGHEIDNNSGNFEDKILLAEGENIVEIVVKLGKKMNKQVLYIDSDQSEDPISLSLNKSDNKVVLNWEYNDDLDNSEAFEVIKSTAKQFAPETLDINKSDKTNYTFENLEDGEYYFKVCFTQEDLKGICSNIEEANIGENKDSEITLQATLSGKDVKLSWTYSNPDTESFRTVYSTKTDPTYPEAESHSIAKSAFVDTWQGLDTGTYYFRVCAIVDDKCSLYSNNYKIVIENQDNEPEEPETPTPTGSISLKGSAGADLVILEWSLNNIEAPNGYKILMSENANPTIANGQVKSTSSENERALTWMGLTPETTYHFRVCQIENNDCGTYSNNISITTAK